MLRIGILVGAAGIAVALFMVYQYRGEKLRNLEGVIEVEETKDDLIDKIRDAVPDDSFIDRMLRERSEADEGGGAENGGGDLQ